jgi:hypothetical protein
MQKNQARAQARKRQMKKVVGPSMAWDVPPVPPKDISFNRQKLKFSFENYK